MPIAFPFYIGATRCSRGAANILEHLDLGALASAKGDAGLSGRVDDGEEQVGEAVLVVVAGADGEGDVFIVRYGEEEGGCGA